VTKVVVNGTFDILHLGHLKLLEYASGFPGSYVLVLTDSDRRIKELKGNDRPINNEYERSSMLFALKYVDRVEVFDTDQEDVFSKDKDPVGLLKEDLDNIPVILGLSESSNVKQPIIRTLGSNPNTFVSFLS
jgi:cytidyltransferase-like protein